MASIYKWEESGYWWNQSEVWGNTNGSYSVENLVPGTYRVLFSPRGVYYDYLPMAYGGGGSEVEDGLDVIVPVDTDVTGIDGALPLGSRISGQITDNETGGAVSGVRVEMNRWTDQWGGYWQYVDSLTSVSNGSFLVRGVSPGTYRVMFHPNTESNRLLYTSVAYGGGFELQDGSNVVVTLGQDFADIDGKLIRGANIEGTVTDAATGTGVQDVRVMAREWVDLTGGGYWSWGDEINVDSNGFYRLTSLPPGTYRVGFSDQQYPSRYLEMFYNGAFAIDDADDIVATNSGTISGIDAALVPGSIIEGTVTLSGSGAPVENVYVAVYQEWTSEWGSGWNQVGGGSTDSNGVYKIGGLIPGTYRVVFYPATGGGVVQVAYGGGPDAEHGGDVVVPVADTVSGIDGVLPIAGAVSGRVLAMDGSPISNAVIVAENRTYQQQATSMTDTAGVYNVTGLYPGSYAVGVRAEDYADEWSDNQTHADAAQLFSVASGATVTDKDFDLDLGQSPALVEVTSDPSGAMVYINHQPSGLVTPVTIDIGEAASSTHRIGSHTITVQKEGYLFPTASSIRPVEADTVSEHFDLLPVGDDNAGELEINSTPAGATVYVDYMDQPLGVTPLVVSNLYAASSSHLISLNLAGYLQPPPLFASVAPGSRTVVDIPLVSVNTATNTMVVNVTSSPEGATVIVDYMPTETVTDTIIYGLDPASHHGHGWYSASHTVMVSAPGAMPPVPRYAGVSVTGGTDTVHFELLGADFIVPLEVVANPPEGGSVSGSGTFYTGSVQRIVAVAATDWLFTGWSDGDLSADRVVTVSVTGGLYTARFEPVPAIPLQPLHVAPLDDAVTIEHRPELEWEQPGGNASWCNLLVYHNGREIVNRWVEDLTTWTPDSDLPHGDYSWWLHPWSSEGYGPWSAGSQFRIEAALPGAVSPVSPIGGGALESGARMPTLTWTQSGPAASWYHVWITHDSEPYIEEWVQTPEFAITTALAPGTYGWWVQPWNSDGLGAWSDGAAFLVEASIPATPRLTAPFGMQAGGSLTYTWQHDSIAVWYQLFSLSGETPISKWYLATDIAADGEAQATEDGHTWGEYQWFVRGWAPDGMGAWSDVGTFTCGKPVPVSGSDTLLTWDDSHTTDAEWYNVWISNGRSWWFERAATTGAGNGSRQIPLTPALPVGNYEWFIRAWSSVNGTGPWSDAQAFDVP